MLSLLKSSSHSRAALGLCLAVLGLSEALWAVPSPSAAASASPSPAGACLGLLAPLPPPGALLTARPDQQGQQDQPDDPVALLRQARILMRNGKTAQSIAVLERLVVLDPESITARLNLGRMYMADGQVQHAKEALEAVAELDPYNEAAFCELTSLYCLTGQPDVALKIIEPVLRDHPFSAAAQVAKAQALIKMNRPEEARALLDSALEVDPESYEAHFWMANLALQAQAMSPAVAHLRRCLDIQHRLGLDPIYGIRACELLGDLYLRLGRFAEAITMFDNVAPVTKNRFAVNYKLGVAHGMMFHYDKAAKHLLEAIGINPRDYLARIRYAYILEAQDFLEQALKQYQIAGEIDATQSFVHHRIGNILLQLGRRDEAKQELLKAIQLGAFNAEPFCMMAKALREEGSYKEATEYLEKGLELDPLHVESYYLLSQILPRTGDPQDRQRASDYARIYKMLMPQKDKIAKYTSMLEISPSQVNNRIELVKMLRQIGKTEASMRYLNDGIKVAPQNVALRKLRADVCLELGMSLPARRDLLEARRILEAQSAGIESASQKTEQMAQQVQQIRKMIDEIDALLSKLQGPGAADGSGETRDQNRDGGMPNEGGSGR